MMKLTLMGLLFIILFLKANSQNNNHQILKRNVEEDAMERRFSAKIDAMEERLSKMDAMEKRLSALEQQQDSTDSFFSVQLREDTEVAHNGTIMFNLVVVNYGDNYIQSGGIYIAPEDGYYMFTLVIREDGEANCAGSVMRTPASDPNNATMLCRAEYGEGPWQTGSCTVIAQLFVGDQVSVIADGYFVDVENSFYMAHGFTSLTGLLIKSGLE